MVLYLCPASERHPPQFLSELRSKCDVTGVTGVTALFHAGFGVTGAAVTGVTDVTARAVYGLKKMGHIDPEGSEAHPNAGQSNWVLRDSGTAAHAVQSTAGSTVRRPASRARTGLAGRAVDNWFWRNLVRNHGSSLPCVPACVPARQSPRAAGHCLARVHLGSPSFGLLGYLNNLIWDALDERRYSHRGVLI